MGVPCDSTPEGHPFGETCNPNLPLPTPPPSSILKVTDESIDGRLSDECPPSAEFGSCAGYVSDLQCEFDNRYTGCTWDTLRCTPIMDCQCDKFGDGSWACLARSMIPCTSTPDGHPHGNACNPNLPLPTPPPSSSLTMSTGVMAKAKAQNEKAMRWIANNSAPP